MHRYTLEPYHGPASRYTCPECNSKRTFSRYIDTQTNNHIAGHVGRCSREDKCGYHFKPKEWLGKGFIDNGSWLMAGDEKQLDRARLIPTKNGYEPSTINHELFARSLSNYHQNNFTNWLIKLFGEDVTGSLISKYLIGTSKHWRGSTVFWQVDEQGNIRTGKIMLYGANGKRIKEPYNHINWVHALLRKSESRKSPEEAAINADRHNGSPSQKTNHLSDFRSPGLSDFHLKQCLFGEHLLKEALLAPVAIVESEKSAIIASVYWPQFIWLAAGSLSNLNADKCGVLKGRNVTLFPDLNCFDKWEQKARSIKLNFKTSALLETVANNQEREQGQDVADYLLKFDWQEFRAKAESVKAESEKVKAESEKQEGSDCPLPTAQCQLPPDVQPTPEFSFNEPQNIVKAIAHTFNCKAGDMFWQLNIPKPQPIQNKEIDELEAYFTGIELPKGPIRINKCSVIRDVRLFIDSHLVVVKRYHDKDWFRVYLERLRWLKAYLEGVVVGNEANSPYTILQGGSTYELG
ncbi:DUF6965 family protein [Mucilaginibacter sp. OK098]|uniref:DUF6965 family protein n=1 Tax=Mucilaginibacter sp. OK098 TaxID=1855297 RepID=UPI00091ABF79|nr:DUF6371 domain-containing protein [Mucilaginibacter sp. OK098]SHL88830.1 hypothetical protein SAMN05216524_10169 [Mucilaginibacter sp. OK098]